MASARADVSNAYRVKFKQPTGFAWREGVVNAVSPRQAVGAFCKSNRQLISHIVKYGSWRELQQAFLTQGGTCTLCEVNRVDSDRKNYYVLFTVADI